VIMSFSTDCANWQEYKEIKRTAIPRPLIAACDENAFMAILS